MRLSEVSALYVQRFTPYHHNPSVTLRCGAGTGHRAPGSERTDLSETVDDQTDERDGEDRPAGAVHTDVLDETLAARHRRLALLHLRLQAVLCAANTPLVTYSCPHSSAADSIR